MPLTAFNSFVIFLFVNVIFVKGVLGFDFDKMTGEDYLHLLSQLPYVIGDCGNIFPASLQHLGVDEEDDAFGFLGNVGSDDEADESPIEDHNHDAPLKGGNVVNCILLTLSFAHKLVIKHRWTEEEVSDLHVELNRLHDSKKLAFGCVTKSKWRKPKIHQLLHLGTWIEDFGALIFICSSSFETNHIYDVKLCCKRVDGASDVPLQLMKLAKVHLIAFYSAFYSL